MTQVVILLYTHTLFQDTIIALQGLSEMAEQIYSPDFDMTVTISRPPGSDVTETFNITADNALIFQSRDVSSLVLPTFIALHTTNTCCITDI